MSGGPQSKMFEVFNAIRERLQAADLSFTSAAYRDDAMSLLVNEPGHYWEIDVLEDGSVDVEVYSSQGLSDDPLGDIDSLIKRNTEQPTSERKLNHGFEDPPVPLGRQEASVLPHRGGRCPRAARRPLRREDRHLRSAEAP